MKILLTERLINLRERNNWSKTLVAQKLNLNARTYMAYENEEHQPDIKTLIDIANLYNVSLDYLVGNEVKYTKVPTSIKTLAEAVSFLEQHNLGYLVQNKETDAIIELAQTFLFVIKK